MDISVSESVKFSALHLVSKVSEKGGVGPPLEDTLLPTISDFSSV